MNIVVTLEGFNDTPHDHALVLKTGPALTVDETPDTVVTKTLDLADKRYERTYTFTGATSFDHFCIIQTGSTNSALDTYHVAERTYVAP